MSWWSYPGLGPVRPIPRRRAPRKTWRHFYAPDERWEQIVDASPHDCWRTAVDAGAPAVPPGTDVPDDLGEGTQVVQLHHARYYRPGYVTELKREGTAAAPKRIGRRWVARTPGAVYVVIEPGNRAKPAEIVTAYRPHPPGQGVPWTEADFLRQADWLFEKETGMKPDHTAVRLIGELDELLATGAEKPSGVWWLAHTVARGRCLEADPSLERRLKDADEILAEVDPAWIEQLVGVGPMEEQLAAIRVGLKDEDHEELEQALRSFSDWLDVAVVLGRGGLAVDALERASSLLEWIDGAWLDLVDLADDGASAGAGGSLSRQLWAKVADAVHAALAQAGEPLRLDQPKLVDRLVPPEPVWWEQWTTAANSAPEIPASTTARRELARFQVEPAAARALGGSDEWAIQHAIASASDLRLFFVEPAYPDGLEMTTHLSDPEASVWLLEQPDAEALAVLFVGPLPTSLHTLRECLDYALTHDDVAVATRRFTRSS